MASGEYLHDKNTDRLWKLMKRVEEGNVFRFGSSFELLDPMTDDIIQVPEDLLLRGVSSHAYVICSPEQGKKLIAQRRVEQLEVGDIIRTRVSGTRRRIVNIARMSSDHQIIVASLQHCESGAVSSYHVTHFLSGFERGFISVVPRIR
jgi:hypothetical protein